METHFAVLRKARAAPPFPPYPTPATHKQLDSCFAIWAVNHPALYNLLVTHGREDGKSGVGGRMGGDGLWQFYGFRDRFP